MTQTLVTVEHYRTITGDDTSAASAITARLEDALDRVEDYLQRRLESATFTETLEVWYEDGVSYVYPLTTPITSIPASATYAIDEGERRLRGVQADSISGGAWPTVIMAPPETSAISPFGRNRPDFSTVTYTGGFTVDTLPATLRDGICFVARGLLFRNVGSVVGATEVSVGDVRVKYPALGGSIDALAPGTSTLIRGYKRRRVRF